MLFLHYTTFQHLSNGVAANQQQRQIPTHQSCVIYVVCFCFMKNIRDKTKKLTSRVRTGINFQLPTAFVVA
jgi:hypothetical protein